MRNLAKSVSIFYLFAILAGCATQAQPPRNIIILIGDGMGPEQVKAASLYATGREDGFEFQKFYRGELTTSSSGGETTDSAAAGTALGTGHKTTNTTVGQSPDGKIYPNYVEVMQKRGKATGLVTTVLVTDATPAGFGAHARNRGDFDDIAHDYLNDSRPNLILGPVNGGNRGLNDKNAQAAGYTLVQDRAGLQQFLVGLGIKSTLDVSGKIHVTGQFGTGDMQYEYDAVQPEATNSFEKMPHLTEMAAAAIQVLSRDRDGFFLMVEGGAIDHAGHNNKIERNIFETVEFAKTADAAIAWARQHPGTVVVVTADHETGGLKVVKDNGKDAFPGVKWSTGGHTKTNVPLYIYGLDGIGGTLDNTDLFWILTK